MSLGGFRAVALGQADALECVIQRVTDKYLRPVSISRDARARDDAHSWSRNSHHLMPINVFHGLEISSRLKHLASPSVNTRVPGRCSPAICRLVST